MTLFKFIIFWGWGVYSLCMFNGTLLQSEGLHYISFNGGNISLIAPLIELFCCRHYHQRNTMQSIPKATENWPRQDIATLFDDMGSFHDDDDAPFAKLSRSFHCQRVEKFKWFRHILSGTISIVIIIINFLRLMHYRFFFSCPFFPPSSRRHARVFGVFYSSFLIKLNCWNKLQEFRLTFSDGSHSQHSMTSLLIFSF